MHIVDSLDSEDESVRAKTFDLLSKITTANNCDVIIEKMLSFLRKSNDRYVRADFALKTSQTIEKFAPDAKWFLENTNKVIELLQGEGHEPTIPEFESSALIAERVKNAQRRHFWRRVYGRRDASRSERVIRDDYVHRTRGV